MALKGLTTKTQKKIDEALGVEKKKYMQHMIPTPQKPKDSYAKKRDELFDRYLETQPFKFDINSDKLYAQYADQYKRQGDAAMRDTVADAAAKTGGYSSSYGINAGAQAYQGYLDKLNDIVPTLEERAYERYKDNMENDKEKLDILDKLDDKEYDRYRDDIADHRDTRDYYREIYEDENDADLDMYKLLTDYILKLASLENQDYHDTEDRKLGYAKLYK